MKPSAKVAVVCFLWGDWPEDKPELGPEYVRRLRDSVFKNSTVQCDFITFMDPEKYFSTDLEHVCRYVMPSRFQDLLWNLRKISMFSCWAGLIDYEWVVALDLDLLILGNIDFLLEHRSKGMMTCMAAYQKDIGGSVVAFDPAQRWCEDLTWWLLNNTEELEKRTKGSERKFYRMAVDKGVLPEVQYWQAQYPGKILSYKVDGIPSNGEAIVRFHGQPRPHQTEAWHVG